MPINRNAIDRTGLFSGRPDAEHYDPPKADKELATALNEWFQQAYEYRLPQERVWELNRLYLKGDQLLARNKVSGEIIRLSTEDSRRLRATNNILRPTSRSLIGKLAKLVPTYRVLPATADFEEMEAAQTADAILQFARQKEDLDLVYTELCEFLPWAGNAFVQLVWDKLAGQEIAFCEVCNYYSNDKELVGQPCPACVNQRSMELEVQKNTGQAIQAEAMAAALGSLPANSDVRPLDIASGIPASPPVPQQQLGPLPPEDEPPMLVEAREGDVRAIVRDPRDVFVPAGTLDLKQATRYCIREVMEVAEAARRFPHFAPFLKADAHIESARAASYRFGGTGVTGGNDELTDHCFVYEYWERPTELYPEGCVIYTVNGIIVEEMESPYGPLKRPNLYHFGFDPVKGEFYRDAYITHAWHRQKALNKLETQLDEHIDQVLRMKLLNPLGSRITASEFRSDTAQVIDYNPAAGVPTPLQVPDLPMGVWNRKTDLRQDVQFLASVTESESGLGMQDPNGRAMAIINAEADQQIGPIVHRNNSEWRELHRGILLLYQKFAHPDRIATIAGSEGLATVYFGRLLNLKPGWDIRMEQEEGLSRNPAVRLQQASELAQIGFFIDPMTGMFDRKAFARYAKLSVPDAGADLEATERAAASQIPYLIQQGQPWTPRNFDVPVIFKEVLESWLRGPGRKAKPEISAQVEQAWAFYSQWAVMQMMGQGGMPGQGQPGGQGSQPGGMSGEGGTPNSPGNGVQSDAQQQVKQADAQGESLARQGSKHES